MNQQEAGSQEVRSASFHQLKPACIKLSEVALREKPDPRQLNTALAALQDKIRNVPILDAKLADYTFFPLSYVIKNAETIPAKSLSIAVQCLEVLIRRGWRSKPNPTLSRELLVFLTIQLSRSPQDDLMVALLRCTATLIESMPRTINDLFKATKEDNVALAGQLIGTLLGITKDSSSVEVQIDAAETLEHFVTNLQDRSLLQKFLPGLVSQLSSILASKTRRARRVLESALELLQSIIKATLCDHNAKGEEDAAVESWRKATASQLLLTISTFISLRYHERTEVRKSLGELCLIIIDDCSYTLENCRTLCLETLCIISSQDTAIQSYLDRMLLSNDVLSALQELLLKWLQTLPRKLQSQDETAANRHVDLVCEGYRAVHLVLEDHSFLNDELKRSIEGSATILLNESKHPSQIADLPDLTIKDLVLANESPRMEPLGSLNSRHLQLLQRLVAAMESSVLLENVQESSLPSLWLLRQSLTTSKTKDQWLEDFVDITSIPGEILDIALNRALDVLTDGSEDIDWRGQALSLDLLVLIAQQEGEEFRTSLVDVLFPMVELLGTKNPFLRQYAVRSLNAVSSCCGYSTPGDMIVQNVDYLVNAVALKFNTFDVSPQAAQVLIMMLELSGPALIPYLDDLVDSIFGALAAYHGYPRLVEVMFSVLAAIVKHGSSMSSSIMTKPMIEHKKSRPPQSTKIFDIPAILEKIRNPPSPPQNEDNLIEEDPNEETALQTTPPSTALDKPLGQPKVYTMVESVLRLSQHYLTHQEPYLRQRLLELVSVGCTSLARNEEQFLPLVNDIWPVVIRRLNDQETIVSLAAMQALSALFIGAGDFMSTRVQDEWDQITSLFRSIEAKALAERKGRGGRGIFAYSERLFDGMVDMLVQLVMHVRVTAKMEDDLFQMLGSLVNKKHDVREALDVLNSDALWLLEMESFERSTPQVEGFTFVDIKT